MARDIAVIRDEIATFLANLPEVQEGDLHFVVNLIKPLEGTVADFGFLSSIDPEAAIEAMRISIHNLFRRIDDDNVPQREYGGSLPPSDVVP